MKMGEMGKKWWGGGRLLLIQIAITNVLFRCKRNRTSKTKPLNIDLHMIISSKYVPLVSTPTKPFVPLYERAKQIRIYSIGLLSALRLKPPPSFLG